MQANTQQLLELFDPTVLYQVPLFQRPYVWNEEKNWDQLWDDIQSWMDKSLHKRKLHPHFIGAVVLEQVLNPSGSVGTRLVIDGQQRFTTLQIFLIAARNLAGEFAQVDFQDSYKGLVTNRKSRTKNSVEEYKLWPTSEDRKAYVLVHSSASDDALTKALKADPALRKHNIVQAYQYFSRQLHDWVNGKLDNPEDPVPASVDIETRFQAIWDLIENGLQVVVIDLYPDDETQVIFETLNAKGTPLLPADLIKNYLFREAKTQQGLTDAELETINATSWAPFQSDFWREEISQGRLFRPRIDLFINHYLSMMTCDDVRATHLFNAFRDYVEEGGESKISIPKPVGADQHIAHLATFGAVFLKFYEPGDHAALARFLQRLAAVDTATVYPFLLYAHHKLMPDDQAEFDKILAVLEAFLMRRLITRDTPKNYNKFFVDLIGAMDKEEAFTAEALKTYLAKSEHETSRYPTNEAVLSAILERPIYKDLTTKKLREVLVALDVFNANDKSESVATPKKLTIEHVLPQKWQEHWPLAAEVMKDPVEREKAKAKRDAMLQTLGNLTLINDKLNPSLSNASWADKRPELLKFSKLNLTRYFHEPAADQWDEAAIFERSKVLLGQILRIWPDVPRPTAVPTEA